MNYIPLIARPSAESNLVKQNKHIHSMRIIVVSDEIIQYSFPFTSPSIYAFKFRNDLEKFFQTCRKVGSHVRSIFFEKRTLKQTYRKSEGRSQVMPHFPY